MTYDHIQDGMHLAGPYEISAPYIRKTTRCGTPEVLLTNGIIDLGELGKIVPRSYPELSATQKYSGTVIVMENATAMEVVDKTAEELAAEAREQFKAQRQQIVDNIKVTTQAGNTFDGDEVSQTRMTRATNGLRWLREKQGITTTILWVLADNTVIQATEDELNEALILAGQAQADAWVP